MESDGIEEALHGAFTIALTTAARIAEIRARAREKEQRAAEAASLQEARELQSRMNAEMAAARAELARVYQPGWWDQASRDEIAHAYQQATEWSAEDAGAARAQSRIHDEVKDRYGIDLTVDAPSSLPDRTQTESRRETPALGSSTRDEATDLAVVTATADLLDAEQAQQSAAAAANGHIGAANDYDSRGRREHDRAEMVRTGVELAVADTVTRADVGQGRPAKEATRTSTKAAKARKARGSGAGQERSRSGLGR